jgi:N-acetylmuramoyl-L-alanine amidase
LNGPVILENLLSYVDRLESRDVSLIDLAVIHCTELPDLATARTYGERIRYPESGTGNSGHFYIERSGQIVLWVPVSRVAHHVRNCNRRSIGIELVNTGRYPEWFDSRKQTMSEPYPSAQINSLIRLLVYLGQELKSLEWLAGHEDLDTSTLAASDNPEILVQRKMDPGPLFPWEKVLVRTGLKRLLSARDYSFD